MSLSCCAYYGCLLCCCCRHCHRLDSAAAQTAPPERRSTFIPPAEDTPVNPFLRRRGSLNNKRAEQTWPFAPGEDGGRADPRGHTLGVCYTAAGRVRISPLGEIVNRFHTERRGKKKLAASLSDFHRASLDGVSQKKTSPLPPPPSLTPEPNRLCRLEAACQDQLRRRTHHQRAALSRLPTDVASFAPLRTERRRPPLPLISSVDGGDGSQITAGRYTPPPLSL